MRQFQAEGLHSPSVRAGMAVRVSVLPARRCLFDEPVQICVAGLQPRQAVTLRASLLDESGELFQAHALYRAESSGELDLSRSPALGGSYLGVEPMGLLWALQSKTPYKRLAKRNVLTPLCVDLEVYEGHGDMSRLLGKCTHERWFLGEGVKRISVREGRLRATLFLPPGEFEFHSGFPDVADSTYYAPWSLDALSNPVQSLS